MLGELEALLESESLSPREAEEAMALLALAADGSDAELSRDLRRFLAAQLGPLASGRLPPGDERRRRLLQGARQTASLLRQKLRAARRRAIADAAASPLTAPINDGCASAIELIDGSRDGTTNGATADGSASCGTPADGPDVWYSYTTDVDELVVWDTFGLELDTVLSLHSACPQADDPAELACNDDAPGTTSSRVVREMSAGETVLVRVSTVAGASGDFTLRTHPGSSGIAGTVTDAASGEPLAGAEVSLSDFQGILLDVAATTEHGEYLFTVFPSLYRLHARHSDYVGEVWQDHQCSGSCRLFDGDPVSVESGVVHGIDFALDAGATIEGTVFDGDLGGEVLTNIGVIAYDAEGTSVGTGSTLGSGRYSIGGLAAGAYTLRTNSAEYFDELYGDLPCHPSCDVTAGTPVAVTAGAITSGVDFEIRRLGSLSGRLTSARDGSPIASSFVELFDATGRWLAHGFTGPDGTYTLERLGPGEYLVRSWVGGFFNVLYKDVPCQPFCDVTVGTPIPVVLATETRGIDFSLEEFGRIAGFVSGNDTGQAVQATIVVFDAAGARVTSRTATGAYEVPGLPPGSYFVSASRPTFDATYENQLYRDVGCEPSCDVTTGTPVITSTSTTTTGIDFVLDRCPHHSHRTLEELTIDTAWTVAACRTYRVGPNVTVTSTGGLAIEAGELVVFGDGFAVEAGGRLEVAVPRDGGSP